MFHAKYSKPFESHFVKSACYQNVQHFRAVRSRQNFRFCHIQKPVEFANHIIFKIVFAKVIKDFFLERKGYGIRGK